MPILRAHAEIVSMSTYILNDAPLANSPTHIEPVQESLYVPAHNISSNLLFPLEHTLGDGRHGRIVTLFDTL